MSSLPILQNNQTLIIINPEIMNGIPHIKGTQITLDDIMAEVDLDSDIEEIIREYPELTPEDITEVINYVQEIQAKIQESLATISYNRLPKVLHFLSQLQDLESEEATQELINIQGLVNTLNQQENIKE